MQTLQCNQAIIILGMHRSGTSALAGVLAKAGIDFGNRLLPAMQQNPKGFWEHEDIVAIHELALRSLGSFWDAIEPLQKEWDVEPFVGKFSNDLRVILDRDFSHSIIWGVKDPRLCRLLPLWRNVLEDIGCRTQYILVIRDPAEVAQSLQVRNGLSEIRATLSWMEHTLAAEKNSRGQPRVWVRYEDLMTNWRQALAPLFEDHLNDLILTSEAEREIDAFLDPLLRHQKDRTAGYQRSEPMRLAQGLYEKLPLSLNDQQIDDDFSNIVDQIQRFREQMLPWIDCLHSDSIRFQNQLEMLDADRCHLHKQIDGLQKENTRIKSSLSWKLGMPLRLFGNLVHAPKSTLAEILRHLPSYKKRT